MQKAWGGFDSWAAQLPFLTFGAGGITCTTLLNMASRQLNRTKQIKQNRTEAKHVQTQGSGPQVRGEQDKTGPSPQWANPNISSFEACPFISTTQIVFIWKCSSAGLLKALVIHLLLLRVPPRSLPGSGRVWKVSENKCLGRPSRPWEEGGEDKAWLGELKAGVHADGITKLLPKDALLTVIGQLEQVEAGRGGGQAAPWLLLADGEEAPEYTAQSVSCVL